METPTDFYNTTVTIYVEPSGVMPLLTTIKILDQLPIDNDYTFNKSDITYSTNFNSGYTSINIPVNLYLKFRLAYHTK